MVELFQVDLLVGTVSRTVDTKDDAFALLGFPDDFVDAGQVCDLWCDVGGGWDRNYDVLVAVIQ